MSDLVNMQSFKTFPQLETERLILRAYKSSDLNLMHHIKSDKGVLKYLDRKPSKDVSETQKSIDLINTSFDEGRAINWIIELKETHESIGDLGIWNIDFKNARGEIGYALRESAWGKGYMTEALKAVIDFGFNQFNLHSFEANINPLNNGSRKLLQRLNFKKEAFFKESYYFDGHFLDSEIYSLIEKWFNEHN